MTPIEYKNEVSVIEEGYRGETLHAREEERDGALVAVRKVRQPASAYI